MFEKFKKSKKYRESSGQAAISLIFLVGGTVLLVGITLAFLIFSFINSTFGFKAANQALGVVLGGVNDVLARLAGDKNYPGAGGCRSYSLSVNDISTNVKIQRSWGDPVANIVQCGSFGPPPPKGIVYIESSATIFGRKRRVLAVVSVSPEGQVDVVSIKQEIISSGSSGPK